MDSVREHFEQEASEFDAIIVKLIPDYVQMVDALVSALPFQTSEQIAVADLGCGTGTVVVRVLGAFPRARITCLDVAENMIAMSQSKLSGQVHVEWVTGDFSTIGGRGPFDAVVSSLALHHLETDADKRDFFKTLRGVLNPGGVFYNADVVLGSTEFLQALNMTQWRRFMSRSVPDAEIDGNWLSRYYAEDRPAALVSQLDWLRDAGFMGVDVVWKKHNFAVYGGIAP